MVLDDFLKISLGVVQRVVNQLFVINLALVIHILLELGVLGFLGPFDLASGLLLGVSIAVVAPLGDLAVSVIKRSIGIKDMSSILPGHGGMFDRLDAILFAVPTAWVVFKLTGLLG